MATIKSGGTKSRTLSHGTWAKGLSQPPRNKVVATEATTIMLAYSARKYSDQRNPLNSVMYPATSSDSASGRSNGARLVSAIEATRYVKNATGARKPNHTPCVTCAATIDLILSVPANSKPHTNAIPAAVS